MQRLSSLVLALLLGIASGCGETPSDKPPLAKVSGKITLDGKPLEGAIVTFEPQEKGAASTGATDKEGHYTLIYVASEKGAVPGTHLVRVSKLTSEMGEEMLPAIYNVQSTLQKTVNTSDNIIDIELVSTPVPKR